MGVPFRFLLVWIVAMVLVALQVINITNQFNAILVPEQQIKVIEVLALDPKPRLRVLNQEVVLPSLEQVQQQLKMVAKSL